MAEWPLRLTLADKEKVVAEARRRQALGLPYSFADTIRAGLALHATASDEDLKRGEL